jgi:hypothetical protein
VLSFFKDELSVFLQRRACCLSSKTSLLSFFKDELAVINDETQVADTVLHAINHNKLFFGIKTVAFSNHVDKETVDCN